MGSMYLMRTFLSEKVDKITIFINTKNTMHLLLSSSKLYAKIFQPHINMQRITYILRKYGFFCIYLNKWLSNKMSAKGSYINGPTAARKAEIKQSRARVPCRKKGLICARSIYCASSTYFLFTILLVLIIKCFFFIFEGSIRN